MKLYREERLWSTRRLVSESTTRQIGFSQSLRPPKSHLLQSCWHSLLVSTRRRTLVCMPLAFYIRPLWTSTNCASSSAIQRSCNCTCRFIRASWWSFDSSSPIILDSWFECSTRVYLRDANTNLSLESSACISYGACELTSIEDHCQQAQPGGEVAKLIEDEESPELSKETDAVLGIHEGKKRKRICAESESKLNIYKRRTHEKDNIGINVRQQYRQGHGEV